MTTLKYQLTRSDIFYSQFISSLRSRSLNSWNLLIALFMAYTILKGLPGHWWSKGIVACMIIVLFFLFVSAANCIFLLIRSRLKSFKGLLGEHELVVTDDGLIERTPYNETLHRWAGFQKVKSTSTMLLIYVSDHQYHPVPKRSFPNDSAIQDFRNLINSRALAAQQ